MRVLLSDSGLDPASRVSSLWSKSWSLARRVATYLERIVESEMLDETSPIIELN